MRSEKIAVSEEEITECVELGLTIRLINLSYQTLGDIEKTVKSNIKDVEQRKVLIPHVENMITKGEKIENYLLTIESQLKSESSKIIYQQVCGEFKEIQNGLKKYYHILEKQILEY